MLFPFSLACPYRSIHLQVFPAGMPKTLVQRISGFTRHCSLRYGLSLLVLLAGCQSTPPTVLTTTGCPACQCPSPSSTNTCTPSKEEIKTAPALQATTWAEVDGWLDDDQRAAWSAFQQSCNALSKPAKTRDALIDWAPVCQRSQMIDASNLAAVRAFFEKEFIPHQATQPDGNTSGLVTGYYEPLLRGSRNKQSNYTTPLYAPPEDMVTVDLSALYPELKNMRLRGRIEKNAQGNLKLVPYANRGEIAARNPNALPATPVGRVLLWVDDPIDAFFLEVQGSGRIQLKEGGMVRVNYADQNGHPYRSIGRWLVEQGELKLEQASMQGIRAWVKANPHRLQELLNINPSVVFFRELPLSDPNQGPPGALGVPLTEERSIAIDPRHIPLGAPVFLTTTQPNSSTPLKRLMLAQDTGGAIRGVVRADFYWGFGSKAGELAGRMRQPGKMWVLLPKESVAKQ